MSKRSACVTITEPNGHTFPEELEFADREEMKRELVKLVSTCLDTDEIEIHIRPMTDEEN